MSGPNESRVQGGSGHPAGAGMEAGCGCGMLELRGEVSVEMQADWPTLLRIRSGNRRALAGRAMWSRSPSGSVREDRCGRGAMLAAGRPGEPRH